jgi:4'-phosphopantetheinyl transferase
LVFEYNAFGKPFLASSCNPLGIFFNLSHSGSHAVCAVTIDREIGVDIEKIRSDFPYEEISHSVFTPRECHAMLQAPPDERCSIFFAHWTHKEAYIKGRGQGLSMALTDFEVFAPAQGYCLDAPWTFVPIPPLDDYAVALAYEGPCDSLQCLVLQGAFEPDSETIVLSPSS